MAGGYHIEELDKQIQEKMGDITFVGLAKWEKKPNKLAIVFATASGPSFYSVFGLLDDANFKYMADSAKDEVVKARNEMIFRMEDAVAGKDILAGLPLESVLGRDGMKAYRASHVTPPPGRGV